MKFDICVGNPPYSGSLHLDIISSVLPFMSKRATGCFIHPATWLINLRKDGSSALKYRSIKNKLKGHISSICIENFNKKFNTKLYIPFSITNIDMSHTGDIDFTCFGENKKVKSLDDCNLIGDYNTIWSILDKVKTYGDVMKNHIYIPTENVDNDMYYCKYDGLVARGICADYRTSDVWFRKNYYASTYIWPCFDDRPPIDISSEPIHSLKNGYTYSNPVYSDKIEDNLYDTKEHLENWKHFIFNNKLPLFINIVLTIHQQNVITNWVPWLVDKKYTDEEINEKFGFTENEIKLIDDTLKKFERNSPYFKRYMFGKEDPNEVTTIEDSPKKKKKTSTKSDTSQSGSESSKTVVDN